MAEFYDIVKCLFTTRKDYKNISDEDKDKNFFIINRYMSKRFPEKAQQLNHKEIDKSTALDIWFMDENVMSSSYAGWFWDKGKGNKEKPLIPNSDRKLLIEHLELREQDVDFLLKYFMVDVKEELTYLRKVKKEHG